MSSRRLRSGGSAISIVFSRNSRSWRNRPAATSSPICALVADTIGLNDLTWFDKAGHVHSDQLHLVERLRRIAPNKLRLDITFDDPKTFTKTWSAFRYFYLKPDWELDEEILCDDKFLGKPIPLR